MRESIILWSVICAWPRTTRDETFEHAREHTGHPKTQNFITSAKSVDLTIYKLYEVQPLFAPVAVESLVSRNDIIDSSILLSSSSWRDGGERLAGGSRGQGNLIHPLQSSWRRRRRRKFFVRNLYHLISLFSLSHYHLPIGLIGGG